MAGNNSMTKVTRLEQLIQKQLSSTLTNIQLQYGELTLEVDKVNARALLLELRDNPEFSFNQLIDLCAVDYLLYGEYDWETEAASLTGFSRGVEAQEVRATVLNKPRFSVVYHLLSTTHNVRIRVKSYLSEDDLMMESVCELWKGADWFEREAYDFYGILFSGHPDLRRILTDYGFIGHPFRKDFPVSGQVEMRYDAALGKVIYEPVDIQPRVLVPKVIRNDNRYS